MPLKRTGEFLFRWVLPLLILGGTVASVIMLGTKAKPNRKRTPPQVAVPVEVVTAKKYEGPLTIATTGTVVPFREVDLAVEVGGRVVWKSDAVLPGRFVTEGDKLLKIDPVDYELQVAEFEQQFAKAESDIERVRVDKQNTERLIELADQSLKLRSRELNRVKALLQRGAANDADHDAAERVYLDASQQVLAQQNQLRSLDAEAKSLAMAKQLASIGLEKAQRDLQRTTVLAPFSGVVIANMVEANSHVQAGQTIARIEDTSDVEVSCNLRKEDLDFLPSLTKTGTDSGPGDAYRLPLIPASIQYSRAGRTYEWKGVLSRQDGLGMDERTRTMPVRILVDDPQDCTVDTAGGAVNPIALVRGMFVTVRLHCDPDCPLVTVPEETVRPGKTVWLMQDGRLMIQPVPIVRIEEGLAYIDGGGPLTVQHAVISSPVPGAKSGLAVTTEVAKRPKRGEGPRPGEGGGKKRKPLAEDGRQQKKPARVGEQRRTGVEVARDGDAAP